MFWCCCQQSTGQFLYGARAIYLDYASQAKYGVSANVSVAPGVWLTPNNQTPIRPFSIAYFPIFANPSQVINTATFTIAVRNIAQFGTGSGIGGSFQPRLTAAAISDVETPTLASWDAVLAWSLGSAMSFSHGPLSLGQTAVFAFDVTARVQAIVNQVGFQRGDLFAGVVNSNAAPQVLARVSGELLGFGGVDESQTLDPAQHQCTLVIT